MTKKDKKKPLPPRKCIFCNGTPISREHVWAAWMKPYLPEMEGRTHLVTRPNPLTGHDDVGYGPLNLKGDMRSHKLKVVCHSCNNGWMSVLQSNIQGALLPILQGERHQLNTTQQMDLSAWVTMFAMVYEFADPETAAIPAVQRVDFRAAPTPKGNWTIWGAPYDGENLLSEHRGFRISSDNDGIADTGSMAQLTVFTAGKACFFAFSASRQSDFNQVVRGVEWPLRTIGFTRLWPNATATWQIDANRTKPLSRHEFRTIRGMISAFGLGVNTPYVSFHG